MSAPGERRRRVLVVGYDRSEGARRAASWAVSQLLPDGKLVIVYATKGASPLLSHDERAELGRAVVDELLMDGEDSMRDLELEAEVLDEDAAHALIEAARRHGADAIVIGSEPHSRIRRALGDLTGDLLSSSPVPVIAVPPPQ